MIQAANVFSGPNSLLDFMNPSKNIPTPLIELPESCNPFLSDKVRIFAKMHNMLPLGNVKSVPAFNLLEEAKKEGKLNQINTLIENSSGNTVLSLATIGRLMGINSTKAIASHEVTRGKLNLLRFFGVEVIINKEPICPDPSDKTSGIYKAKVWSKEKNWYNPGQYDNTDNPFAHEKVSGPQIWSQTNGKLSLFCCGLGTTGTMVGTSRFLKKMNENIRSIGVVRSPNNPVPGPRTRGLLKQIAFDWEKITDEIVEIGTIESYEKSLLLCRHGLLVGPSSGFALAGLLKFLQEAKEKENLDQYRNEDGEIVASFICCDNPYAYIDKYFEYLDESNFPKIENDHLLLQKPELTQKKKNDNGSNHELDVVQAYQQFYRDSPTIVWNQIINGEKVSVVPNSLILDIRPQIEFDHFHLPESIHGEIDSWLEPTEDMIDSLKGKKVLVICSFGERSIVVSKILNENGIKAYNLKGGTTEWSKLHLPRWRAEVCFR